ncbi:MAG: hypothetical protein P0S95_01605 [Rhabdochlamydiaceae bacterium]|nr:hypothetical protein [Candidatus Amphrikana amoebophyrae]
MISKRRISVQDTDSTGVIYFNNILKFGAEAYEEWISENNMGVRKLIEEFPFLTPIVHTESNILLPLRVDDEIEIELKLGAKGRSSYQIHSKLNLAGKEAANTLIVYVVVDKKLNKSIEIPDQLNKLLDHLV